MNDHDMSALVRAAAERQLAVTALQEKYTHSEDISTEQLVADMRELLATERLVLDAIITLFSKLAPVDSVTRPLDSPLPAPASDSDD
jgi:hypothetical protein